MINKKIYDAFIKSQNISTDTRSIKKNDLFWALKGDSFNGNNYINEAFELGALFIVTDDRKNIGQRNCIYVENSLIALQVFASFYIRKLNIPIIAITGTNGKTTTKELMSKVLSKKFKIGYTKGNLNNHIGVPLTLLSFTPETEIGIVEMGANHSGEIKFLCEIARPEYGIITNIGKAHLEGFGSLDGVISTKNELYSFLYQNKGKIFINDDNEILQKLIFGHDIIKYGTANDIFCKGKDIKNDFFVKCEFQFTRGKSFLINSCLIGSYNFENIMAAVCIGKYFNVNEDDIKSAIEGYIPQNNRSQLINSKNNNKIILDAYNANPTSMFVAIENFINISSNDKVLIVGDMLELGKESLKEHLEIIKKISKAEFNSIYFVGECFAEALGNIKLKSNMFLYKNVTDLIPSLKKAQIKNSNFLVKGSRGIKLEKVLEYL